MTKRKRKKVNGRARPIRTKRDYQGASAAAKRLSNQADRDSAAELRLQSLLRQMDEFEDLEEDASTDVPEGYSGPRRRWSDNGSSDT
jgi:hypothetical protein